MYIKTNYIVPLSICSLFYINNTSVKLSHHVCLYWIDCSCFLLFCPVNTQGQLAGEGNVLQMEGELERSGILWTSLDEWSLLPSEDGQFGSS
jgi:hypothetical protein